MLTLIAISWIMSIPKLTFITPGYKSCRFFYQFPLFGFSNKQVWSKTTVKWWECCYIWCNSSVLLVFLSKWILGFCRIILAQTIWIGLYNHTISPIGICGHSGDGIETMCASINSSHWVIIWLRNRICSYDWSDCCCFVALHAPSLPGLIVSKTCIVHGFAIGSWVWDVC